MSEYDFKCPDCGTEWGEPHACPKCFPSEEAAQTGFPRRETRLITCPSCDPKGTKPDRVSGYDDSLKYLVWGRKCRHCGTILEDLGVDGNNEGQS